MCGSAFAEKTVLVIEDSPVVQQLMRASLQSLGLTIHHALDGASGLQAATDMRPDLILLDIGLPVIDGWGVLAGVRANPATFDTRVIVVTAHVQPHVVKTAEKNGADGFISKPFNVNDLRRVVGDQLLCATHATVAV